MKIIVKNRSGHDMSHMGPYLKSFLPYAQKRMGFNRPPTIFFDSDPQNAENVLGKTAYYNPETEEIVVFVDKRHPKDILRSLSHELVHHSQNCRGDLNPEIAGETTPGYAQTNAHMRAMEGEAYLKGNGYYFRDWEDSLKNGLEETNYKHITGDTHKMANYDQLKEDITAKVVAALTEKLKGKQHKIDADKDGEITAKDFELLRKDESVKEASYDPDSQESGGYTDSTRGGGAREKFVEAMASQMQKKLVNMEDDGTYVKAIFEDGTKGFVGMAAGADGVEAYLYDYRNGVSISDPAEAAAKLDAELKERKKRDTPRDSDRREPEKLKMNEAEEGEGEPKRPAPSLRADLEKRLRAGQTEKDQELNDINRELRSQGINASFADIAGKDPVAAYYIAQTMNDPRYMEENREEQLEEMHCGGKRHDDLEAGMRCPMCGHVVMAEGEEELDEYMAMTSSDYGPDMPEFGGHGLTPAERQAQYEKAKKEKEEEEKRKAAFNSARFQRENEELEEAQEEEVVEETISNDEWYQNELFESLKKRWTK